MEFDYCIPEEARLRAHISQRSNLKYVKTVMDVFDDRQRDEFRNSPFGYLAEVAEIQFSAQLIQQLVFRTIRTDKVNELWFNVQGNMMRFGLQEYTLVTGLRCGVFPKGDEFDRVLERRRLKESRLSAFAARIPGFLGKEISEGEEEAREGGYVHYSWISHCHAGLGVRDSSRDWGMFWSESWEQMPRLLRWSTRKQPQHRTYDAFFKNVRVWIPRVTFEIEQHVTSECKKLRAFFATLVAPPAPTPVPAAMPADTEGGVSGSISQEIRGGEMEHSPDERDMRADTGTAHVQDGGDIAARPDNVHDPLPVATDEQIGTLSCGGQMEPIFAVPNLNDGGAMEPSHAAPSNDADLQGCDVTDGDGDLAEVPVPASVAEPGHGVHTTSRRSARVRRPAPAARTPYTRAAKRTKK
ncbi:Hypothetical predicted protein [Olea europaea subsp. europaea]|uniref:DUF1985 domain-containing protein n=1 Tax=Olea europaea subsp. europaea TaxID=158383 RepID=A0A8S0P7W7_OLEEU|nr:Hypothetical predicted protein [Olea europaea subsp. europaea]